MSNCSLGLARLDNLLCCLSSNLLEVGFLYKLKFSYVDIFLPEALWLHLISLRIFE